jgi:hypothetical protein
MHRSSGSPKYRKNKDYFRINLVQKASFFADKNGNPSQNPEDTHIAWETCSDFEHVVFNIVKMYSKP